MSPLFVETSAFIALVDRKDRNHGAARRLLKTAGKQKRSLVSSSDVFDETITLSRYRLGHEVAAKLGDRLLRSSWCRLILVDHETREAGWQLFLRYDDQMFSFTDCTSFAIMQSMGIAEAFTFDRDFTVAGFVALP